MNTYSRAISRIVARVRARALLALAVYYVSGCLLYLGLGLTVYLVLPSTAPGQGWILAVGGLAIGGGVLAALVRRPSRVEVVRRIDRELGLEQRLETAVDSLADSDRVADLLRRDTLARIKQLEPAELYPLRLGIGSRALRAAALVAVAVAVSLSVWGPVDGFGREGSRTRGTATPPAVLGDETIVAGTDLLEVVGPPPEGSKPVSALDRPSPGETPIGDGDTAREEEGTAAGDRSGAIRPESSRPDTSPSGTSLPEHQDDVPSRPPGRSAPQGTPAAGAKPTPRDSALELGAEPGSGPTGSVDDLSTTLSSSSVSDSETPVDGSGDLTSDASPAGGAGAPGLAAQGHPPAAIAARELQLLERYDAATNRAWDGIEAALARETIPPGLEQHVRNYFAALRAEGL